MDWTEIAKIAPVVAVLGLWIKWLLDRLKDAEKKNVELQSSNNGLRDDKATIQVETVRAMAESEKMVMGTLDDLGISVTKLIDVAQALINRGQA